MNNDTLQVSVSQPTYCAVTHFYSVSDPKALSYKAKLYNCLNCLMGGVSTAGMRALLPLKVISK